MRTVAKSKRRMKDKSNLKKNLNRTLLPEGADVGST